MKFKAILVFLLAALLVACNNKESAETDQVETVNTEEGVTEEANSDEEDQDMQGGNTGTVNISAAASLQYSIEEITEMYNKENDIEFNLNFGGSGALREQIEAGADVDLFISANKNHMDTLVEKGYINEDTLVDLLINEVVLIVPKENAAGLGSIEDLTNEKVEVVALGEPESVPVGEYSQQILDFYGIKDEVNKKASYGSDVTQVLNWVDLGEADVGFVYRTDSLQKDNIEVIEVAPAESHEPVVYPAAVLQESQKQENAQAFLEYLQGEEAMAIFEKYGFGKAE